MPLTDAQKNAHKNYFKENYKQVKLSMPKSEAEALDKYCKARNLSKAGFIRQLIKDRIAEDGEADIE